MPDSDGKYGTVDLAEATVLSGWGFSYELERLSKTQARWVFTPPIEGSDAEDKFWETVQRYKEGACTVEPRSFLLEVKKVRNELYTFLGDNAPLKHGAVTS